MKFFFGFGKRGQRAGDKWEKIILRHSTKINEIPIDMCS